MGVFERLGEGYEQVVFGHDPETGLRTIIAIYSTARGPALGGTRMWPFASEEEALEDVLRLAKAMAYKAACADLPLGGGKAVVIGDPHTDKTPQLLRAYARVVDSLGGRYITSADVGTTVDDLDIMAEETRHVTGSSRGAGDPSPVTAHGVRHGMRAVAEALFGSPSLAGKHVVVQGVGKVGAALATMLVEERAHVTVADIDTEAASRLAASIHADLVDPAEVLATPCDILAPCALGPVVTDETLATFKCRAIAGAANNQLGSPEHGRALNDLGILYAPDYVINAGGLINVEDELHGYNRERAYTKAANIESTLREVFRIGSEQRITPAEAADHLAEERIAEAERRRAASR